MEKLRTGVRNLTLLDGSDALLRIKQKRVVGSMTTMVNAGTVITEVADEALLGNLELWQQGDATMYDEEALARRLRLRTHKRVRDELHNFWICAQLSYGGGDEFASTIGFEGYAEMLRRIYRVVLRTYDEADATREIASDWARDAKGAERMTRVAFCDALFELADMWTAAICPFEYAAFLRMLLSKLTSTVHGPDGVGVRLWRPEAECTFDEDTFGGGDDDDDEDENEKGGGAAGDDGGSGDGSGAKGGGGDKASWSATTSKKGSAAMKSEGHAAQSAGRGRDGGGTSPSDGCGKGSEAGDHEKPASLQKTNTYRARAERSVKRSCEPAAAARKIQTAWRAMEDTRTKERLRKAVLSVQAIRRRQRRT